MRQAPLLGVGLLALALSACISVTTTIKLKTDGSGTVTQRMVMSPEMAEMMTGLAAMGAEEGAAAPELFPEEKLRSQAADMGPGVTFVSSKKIKDKSGEGVEAVYAFKSIDTLKVEQKPTPPVEGAQTKGESEAPDFHLTHLPNGHALLTVVFPEPKKQASSDEKGKAAAGKKPKAEKKKPSAKEMQQAKEMLKGLRIGLYLDAGKKVVKTNSPYLDGNRVILMELDFEALLSDEKQLKKLMAVEGENSIEAVKQALKGIPGIKVHLDRKITIEFK
jgi:hypothetical protein